MKHIEIGGIQSNPILEKVYEIVKFGKTKKVEAILAVGGGSVIDTAKAVAAGLLYEGDIWDAFENRYKIKKALPIFTVLTISGTGSEMNGSFVITNKDKKWAAGSLATFPTVSVIDPEIQCTLTNYNTACGAADAISHILEYYFVGNNESGVIDEISEGLLRAIIKHTRILMNDSNNYNSRCELAWASTMALNGNIRNGKCQGDWSSHFIEHAISAITNIPHGQGMAVVQMAWMKYIMKDNMDKISRIGRNVFGILERDNEEVATNTICKFEEFYKEIGIDLYLDNIGVKKEELDIILNNIECYLPIGKIKRLKKADIKHIFNLCYKEY